MTINFDASDFLRGLDAVDRNILTEGKVAMHDATDDLLRISRDIAPIDKGLLRQSGHAEVNVKPNGTIVGTVSYSAKERDGNGVFDYAVWTHEMDYDLGAQSNAAPGTDGYDVGNKYLERPLQGESEKYVRWLTEGVARGINESGR